MGSGDGLEIRIALRLLSKQPRMKRADRPRCGARTRKGRPCRAPAVWDRGKDQALNGRCRLHGGLSTGPKTKVGRDAIRASNSRRSKLPCWGPRGERNGANSLDRTLM